MSPGSAAGKRRSVMGAGASPSAAGGAGGGGRSLREKRAEEEALRATASAAQFSKSVLAARIEAEQARKEVQIMNEKLKTLERDVRGWLTH